MIKFPSCTNTARILLCCILLGPLRAADADEFQSRYSHGLRCYSQGDYETAIREFQSAFAIRQLPRLLFNLGQAHRKLGHAREALGYLQNYLRVQTNPTPEDRAELESYIAATRPLVEIAEAERRKIAAEEMLAAHAGAATQSSDSRSAEPAPAALEGPAHLPAAALIPAAPPSLAVEARPSPLPQKADEASPTPVYKKWWFWTALGGSALAITAVGLGVGLAQRNPCGHSAPCFTPY